MLVHVRDFSADHPELFASAEDAAKILAALDHEIAELRRHLGAQAAGFVAARLGGRARRAARRTVRATVQAIARIASATGSDLGETLRLPDLDVRDEALAATARTFAEAAAPHQAVLVARGLPANALADLDAQLRALEQAIAAQNAGKRTHIGAAEAFETALATATAQVDALDGIVRNGSERQPAILALWRNARRVGPARTGDEPPSPPAVAPQPATPEPSPSDKKVA